MADQSPGIEGTNRNDLSGCRPDRRGFLQRLCVGAVAAAGSQAAPRHDLYAAESETAPAKPPMITIGKHRFSRLIVGGNPISGYSHSTQNLARHMREYFTLERTIEFISRCEKMGVNTWQSSHTKKIADTLRTLRERGSKIQWICLTSDSGHHPPLKEILALKPVAVVHHGGVTDTLFRKGRPEKVHDFVKKVHDAGVTAGVSAHNPANIQYVADKNWENQLFMTCFYYVTRPADEIRKKLGTVPLGEPFFKSDPDEMSEVIRQISKPCLAFKILAAGRLCWSRPSVDAAFKNAFARIKKTDGVIVGMYPRFSDELAHNIELTVKYGNTA